MDAPRVADAVRDRLASALGCVYVLGRELRSGAGSRVFSAWDVARGHPAVIRVLLTDDDAAPQVPGEIRLVAGLQHPHIVPVLEVGEAGGLPYYAMPFIEGESLRTRLDREGRLDSATASRILADVAGALAYAHRHGLVHRDVRPENIFLEFDCDRVMLTDFGVARSMAGEAVVTAAGVVRGSPTYMSPEQLEGLTLDGRSDLYSLGLVGWEMLAGQRPWADETLYGIIYDQRFEQLPALGDAAPRLRRAIERALCKDPAGRWPSGDDFAVHLRSIDERTSGERMAEQGRRLQEQLLASDAWAVVCEAADRTRQMVAQVSARVRAFERWPRGRVTSRITWLVAGGLAVLLLLGDEHGPIAAARGTPVVVAMADLAGPGPVPPAVVAAVDTTVSAVEGDVAQHINTADDALERVYRELEVAFLEPAARRELGRAQQVWLADRDRVCARQAGPVVQARCEGVLSRRRVTELSELLARAQGRGSTR
jgi:uncharacterized protein YecT (DUF1311 family)